MPTTNTRQTLHDKFSWPLVVTILGGIIVGVFLLYAADFRPTSLSKVVLVQAADTGEPIPFASVTLAVAGGSAPLLARSDSMGTARFLIDQDFSEKPAVLRVQANDFQPYSLNIDVLAYGLPEIVVLERVQ